ncbi:MerR family transcriptional regulator [Ornithinibacillus halophilus]|uniref:DNA-binding transcriptional regulator, MerR family n=1 Tax=Ornithinibacillus halophilus TaxID=930117 RepID=A0A1M5G1G4_9BACI|nr:MerR family transcriptional regulator [Ornithinibacillus halophilus]SHF97553.1 DNA-binding transcriptional regulator, MerR family [Ornithinibacillus halophilus]
MYIGEFVRMVNSTKDTIRHYEDLQLIHPQWENNRRVYSEEHVKDYEAIKEMQSLGLSLKEIEVMFQLKRTSGCSSPELLEGLVKKLEEKKQLFQMEEAHIREKRKSIEGIIMAVSKSLPS